MEKGQGKGTDTLQTDEVFTRKEYIEREAAYNTLTGYYHHSTDIQHEALREALGRVPAADVLPVVLCKDCKWCHAGYCEKYDDLIPFGCANKPWEDWFCADGEKREMEHD